MAESVSSCVKRIVDKSPFIGEMLTLGILSFPTMPRSSAMKSNEPSASRLKAVRSSWRFGAMERT